MANKDERDVKEILAKTTCRGCYQHCILIAPCCGRSEIFIKEVKDRLKTDVDS